MLEYQIMKMEGLLMKNQSSCDSCSNYVYDEEIEGYECEVSMDEDDMGRSMRNRHASCPYYQLDDEYKIVRKQL